MSDKIRVGIMGYGSIGSVHHEVIDTLDNLEVVSIVDSNPAVLAKVPSRISTHTDYRRLLDDATNIDVVINALPTALHKQSALDTASCGLATLLEKPMAVNSRGAEAIRDTFAAQGVKLMVGMTGRFHPEYVAGFEALGEIGTIFHITEHSHVGADPFPEQYLDEAQFGRGVALTNGIHTIDRFLWYIGERITGLNMSMIGSHSFEKDVEDAAVGSVYFASGSCGYFSFRWSRFPELDCACEVVGMYGTIKITAFNKAVLNQGGRNTVLYTHNQNVDFRERHKPGIREELKAFTEFLETDALSKYADECIAAQRIIDEFYR